MEIMPVGKCDPQFLVRKLQNRPANLVLRGSPRAPPYKGDEKIVKTPKFLGAGKVFQEWSGVLKFDYLTLECLLLLLLVKSNEVC